jgi:hypothetical protein
MYIVECTEVCGAVSFRNSTCLSITTSVRAPRIKTSHHVNSHHTTMNPSDRTKEALQLTPILLARSELLCAAIHDDTTNAKNSSGGTSYLSKILHAVKLEDTSAYAAVPTLGPANDYYTSAQRELTIREQSAGLVSWIVLSTSNGEGGTEGCKADARCRSKLHETSAR